MKKIRLLVVLFIALGMGQTVSVMSAPPTLEEEESQKLCKEGGIWFSFRGPNELLKDFQTYRRLIDEPSWKEEVLKVPQDEYTTIFYDDRRERIVVISSVFSFNETNDIPRCSQTFKEARELIKETFAREKILYQEIGKNGRVFKVIVIIQLLKESLGWTQLGLFLWLEKF
ncbi:MAG: hypothetical protein UU71_C0004G0021 [Parcubacteria group bacterium GW2011_GWB1_41_6]|nr:MAG: hypothetical protein UU71_C0004G0021 [Parcubacteria group bacterium GW2011_GWB1_41_6]KKS33942.1 MAG: hypothetical protein UU96_C0011G0020 [Parcubacteria group bacterium GW2011_GWC2_42_13]KKS56102.1 MAG: hypothetical protein UV22_C0036G0009 [Parcubacteria group bacterium GW2011_GWA2_42_35]